MDRDGILVVGSANMDMVVTAEHFPQPGETILGKKFGMFPGGKGANQAVACAKLGGMTYFIGKMGKDIFKEKLIQVASFSVTRMGAQSSMPTRNEIEEWMEKRVAS